jgi:gas vesicle GvpC-like protein
VISLKDSWEVQRQQRQHELTQRQDHVRQILDQFQQERLVKAAEQRQTLSCFQLDLQNSTQDFLSRTTAERQIQAQQVAQKLRDFAQSIHQQTAQLIAMNAADRAAMSQTLFRDLDEFHANLVALVADLRQEMRSQMQQIQTEVQSLQVATQQMLKANHEQRIQDQIRLMQDLSSYVASLQLEVRDYLSDMEMLRLDRAEHVQQMLQQAHARRIEDVNALFQQLSEFRAELRTFCKELYRKVWGSTPIQATCPASQVSFNNGMKMPDAPVQRPSSMPTPILPTLAPSAGSTKPDSMQLEKDIYQHICQHQGTRLPDLEATMHINRIQAVDALRSLIKQGLVTQRDRVYLAQEEYSL